MDKDKQVLLISGTGGSYTIRGRDLKDSLFDPSIREELIAKYYIVDGVKVLPDRAYYYNAGKKEMLLRRNQSGYPPLVTRTLESILEKNDITYDSIPCDTIWEDRPYRKKEYTFVCLSTTFMWNERMIENSIKWVRENVSPKYLIIGGHYSSIKYEMMFERYPDIDYIIIGDGETALPQVIKYLSGTLVDSLEVIPNLAYIKDGILVKNHPKYESMDEIEKVSYKGKYDRLSYESVRGCAYDCKFCTWDAGIKCFRYKTAAKIISDVKEYIEENGISRIEINDSTFMFPFNRINDVLDGFIELGIHWKAHARADVPWTEDMMRKLDESHCDILQIGFESMCERVLKNMSKRTTPEMNKFTNDMMAKTRVDSVVSFMVGFPDETVNEFQETFEYIVNEFQGHFYLFVFEMEDKSLKLWSEREKYGLVLYEDKEDCVHGGSNWKHNGMTSDMAFELREQVLKTVRKKNCIAIYKSWQSPYEWPLIKNKSRMDNLKIERLIDNLVFLNVDFPQNELSSRVQSIKKQLEEMGVYFE